MDLHDPGDFNTATTLGEAAPGDPMIPRITQPYLSISAHLFHFAPFSSLRMRSPHSAEVLAIRKTPPEYGALLPAAVLAEA